MKRSLKSFQYAGQGFIIFLKTQPNAWSHAAATITVIVLGILISISRIEWALVSFTIGIVWLAESFNTAIEFLGDEITKEKQDRISKAKDVAACGVLCASISALVIGVFVFGRYFIRN